MKENTTKLKCSFCGRELARKDHKKFCSSDCKIKYIDEKKKRNAELRKKLCKQCGQLYLPTRKTHVFCSIRCKFDSRRKAHEVTCKNCGVVFTLNNISYTRKQYNYCSGYCAKKKYYFREPDFTIQTAENMYWLGFMYGATAELREEWIVLQDSKEMLEKFNTWLGGNMPIQQNNGYYSLTLFSRKFVKHMSFIGLRVDHYKEAPIIENIWIKDFIRGYFDTGNGFIYKDNKRPVVAIHGQDSKLMRYFADMLGAKLTYNAKDWIVVSFDLHIGCLGHPRNETKWAKFFEKEKKDTRLIPLHKLPEK